MGWATPMSILCETLTECALKWDVSNWRPVGQIWPAKAIYVALKTPDGHLNRRNSCVLKYDFISQIKLVFICEVLNYIKKLNVFIYFLEVPVLIKVLLNSEVFQGFLQRCSFTWRLGPTPVHHLHTMVLFLLKMFKVDRKVWK